MPDQSKMQKLHIPPEWVEAAAKALEATWVKDLGTGIRASRDDVEIIIAAVIPLIRADERERLAKLARQGRRTAIDETDSAHGDVNEMWLSDWLRAQGDT